MHPLSLAADQSAGDILLSILPIVVNLLKLDDFFASFDFLHNFSCLQIKNEKLRWVTVILEHELALIVMQK